MGGRTKPRRWNIVLLEVENETSKAASTNHIRFKTAQLLFKVVHDDEGRRTRACALTSGKKVQALGNGTSPGTLRFMQAQESISRWENITLEVEGDADRFAGEPLCERDRKALDKRAALGLSLARALASAWQAG